MFPQSTSASDLHKDECGSLGSCEPPLALGPVCWCHSQSPWVMLDAGLGGLRGTGTPGMALVAGTAPVSLAGPAQGSWGSHSGVGAEHCPEGRVRRCEVHQGHGELALGTGAELDSGSAGNVAGEGASPCWGLRGLSTEEGEELLERKRSIGTSTVGYKQAVIKCLQEMRRSVRLPAAGFWKNLQEKHEGRA